MNKFDFNIPQSKEIDDIFHSLVNKLNGFNDLRNLLLIVHTRIEVYLEKMLYSYFFIEDGYKKRKCN